MSEFVALVSVVGGLVAIVAGVLAIRRHYLPESKALIVNPTNQSENGGRFLTVSVTIPRRRRRALYWVAIQPNDCRANGLWWPQNSPLTFDDNDSALLSGVRLGREGDKARHDIGKTFTVGLFEVIGTGQTIFSMFAAKDDPTQLPAESRLLHSVEIRRVYH